MSIQGESQYMFDYSVAEIWPIFEKKFLRASQDLTGRHLVGGGFLWECVGAM